MNHYNVTLYFTNTPSITYTVPDRDQAAAVRIAKNHARIENPTGVYKNYTAKEL